MYVGHLRDACHSTHHIKRTLAACRSVQECHTFACTWSETEIRTQTWRRVTNNVTASWKCLYDVMRVLQPHQLDVNTQKQPPDDTPWGQTHVAVSGIKYNILAMKTCMNFVDSHGEYDAVFRLRFDVGQQWNDAMFERINTLRNNTIMSESTRVWNDSIPNDIIPISQTVNMDNVFWGSQQTMRSLMKTWVRHVVHDTAYAQKQSADHPEHAMCVAAALSDIFIQIPYSPPATLRC